MIPPNLSRKIILFRDNVDQNDMCIMYVFHNI